jgi:hypothetical protein
MDDLIEALQIFQQYVDSTEHNPTHCEHDVLYIMGVEYGKVSEAHKVRLEELGFVAPEDEDDEEGWISFRFGSA